MKKIGVAILGFGVVGSGTYNILKERKEQIKLEYGIDVEIISILVRNIDRAIANGAPQELLTVDIDDIITNTAVDIVTECIGGITPVLDYLKSLLGVGKTIVTANKELLSKHFGALEKIAKTTKAGLYFEATCAGGVPIIRTLTQAMQANRILEIKGIINGTTNYILSRMSEEGASYDDVLKDAQALGFAEADPTADVEGYDAKYKLGILSSLAFNKCLPIELIYCEGITNIKAQDISIGKQFGYTVKLLAIAKQKDNKIEARVTPVFLKSSHPLANVSGSFNAIFLVGDNVGDIMLYGRGAGSLPTGSAVVSDIIFAARQIEHARYQEMMTTFLKEDIIDNFITDYYLRMSVMDKSGVLAKITNIFANNSVSITSMRQNSGQGNAELIFFTHKTTENNIRKAIKELESITEVIGIESLIRVEK